MSLPIQKFITDRKKEFKTDKTYSYIHITSVNNDVYANLQTSFHAVSRENTETIWIRTQADEFIEILVLQTLHLKQQPRNTWHAATSVLGHFGPETELYIQFGLWSIRSLVISVLRTEVT